MKKVFLFNLLFYSFISTSFSQPDVEYADIVLRDTYGKLYSGNKVIDGKLNRCPATLVLGNNNDFICLSMNETLTFGFTDNYILNKKGKPDLKIKESGGESPKGFALVYVSNDDKNYKYAGKAYDGQVTQINFENFNITDTVSFVKIESYHSGFDLTWIKGHADQKVKCSEEEIIEIYNYNTHCYCEQLNVKNLDFDYNDFELNQSQKVELDKLIRLMAKIPELKVEIRTHSDQIGTEEYNQAISNKQAKIIYNSLVGRDTTLNRRLSYVGMGLNKPIHPDFKNKNLKENRRVEVWISGMNERGAEK